MLPLLGVQPHRRIALGEDSVVEHPQPRKLVAHAAHLGVNLVDHVLELISQFVSLALRLRSGASKSHEVAALHWRESFHRAASWPPSIINAPDFLKESHEQCASSSGFPSFPLFVNGTGSICQSTDFQRVVALLTPRTFLALRASDGLALAATLTARAQRLPALAGA